MKCVIQVVDDRRKQTLIDASRDALNFIDAMAANGISTITQLGSDVQLNLRQALKGVKNAE